MKITKEHYEHIKTTITKTVNSYQHDKVKEYYNKLCTGEIKCNNPKVRLMCDLQRVAGLLNFVCNSIYPYADDTHYQTALLKVGKELKLFD